MPKVSDLFDVRYGHSLELNRQTQTRRGEGIAFVSRKMGDNGISAYIEPIDGLAPAPAGELSCALGGNGVLSTFLQEGPFYTGRDVARLIPKSPFSKAELLYYCLCIKANRYRYSYGRQANRSLRDIVIPSVEEVPEFVYQTQTARFEGLEKPLDPTAVPPLETGSWQPFVLNGLFDLRKGKRLTKAQLRPGNVPFISAIDGNNGLRERIDAPARHPAGVLTVNYNGNGVAEAFYQPEPFWASDDVNVLYPRFDGLDLLVGLFFCAVIRLEKYRFNYGRKWNLERMKAAVIRVPVDLNGDPDLEFMRTYIATLPYSSALAGTAGVGAANVSIAA